MDVSGAARNRLLLFGALWGFAMVAVPSVVAFDDPFSISPFLVAAHLCAMLSGAAGALFAGRRVSGEPRSGGWRGIVRGSVAGVSQVVVAAPLAALSIWLMMAINISGFSVENLGEVANLLRIFREPGLWLQSLLVAQAVFVYTLITGTLLSPASGTLLLLLARAHRQGSSHS